MSVVPIVIYCLLAALFIFGLTFHDELLKERRSKSKKRPPGTLIVIDRDRHYQAKRRSRL